MAAPVQNKSEILKKLHKFFDSIAVINEKNNKNKFNMNCHVLDNIQYQNKPHVGVVCSGNSKDNPKFHVLGTYMSNHLRNNTCTKTEGIVIGDLRYQTLICDDQQSGGNGMIHNPKPTKDKLLMDNKTYTIYVGSRGGRYIRSQGKYIAIKRLKSKN